MKPFSDYFLQFVIELYNCYRLYALLKGRLCLLNIIHCLTSLRMNKSLLFLHVSTFGDILSIHHERR